MRSEIPTADDAFLDEAILAAKTTMENACQRQFDLATTSTARSFDPTGTDVLWIHDCTSITTVVDAGGSTLTANTDYRAYPLNGKSNAGESVPYYKLKRNGVWSYGSLLSVVTVTAAWGWPAIPSQIITAVRIIAKDEFNQRDSGVGFGLVAVSDAGGVGSRENMIVRKAVRSYSHPNALGIS